MKEDILIAGYGGQGVVLAGSLIANAAMEQGLEVCGTVSYGVEMRGGTANSSVTISDKKIGSPVILNPTTILIMNDESLRKFEDKVAKGGILILNISECKSKVSREDVTVFEIDATKIAEELGNKRVANVIMVGAYLKSKDILDKESIFKVMKKVFPRAKEEIIELNKKALLRGMGE
ncbi:MAG: 2-oxoacid:acceptor oxidoreductase family protein [Candidatus Woesearchaeota archaeon]|jgi:2-oxoglutarate ferredoxin oxidoreductase subunit gamma|nr:2-oxoacid:acceptor oxidoreductase family protein [Candidatus Woesearchaeota archaeon]MDP7457369.1 2-oxoacid:acceptor oxidoreductase family protein [Candidatus Woesearchaeota archaeon]|tara:strand:+ start:31 stop:561 length:531 start_codon:yes stop_codon:yes gene_type:complete